MSKRSALGRGLGALIPEGAGLPLQEEPPAADRTTARIREVPVDVIALNPHQPRHQIDPEALRELAASIQEHGLIQPLVVSSSVQGVSAEATLRPAQYTLIAGERRLRASKLAGLETVPVLVKEATPREMLELALVENIQRADLNPLEEALAYQQLSDIFGLTQQEIATQVGKNRVSVANALRLLQLPDFCQDALASGQISEGHARALLGLKENTDLMRQALGTVIKQQLNVRHTIGRGHHVRQRHAACQLGKRRCQRRCISINNVYDRGFRGGIDSSDRVDAAYCGRQNIRRRRSFTTGLEVLLLLV